MIKSENKETTHRHSHHYEVAPGVWGMKDKFVNFYIIQDTEAGNWILIDTGLKTSGQKIIDLAGELFENQKPRAIILTHGHFDHTGSVAELALRWKVPVYAHYLEFPYLSGLSAYPPPDPTVGGGLMSVLSPFYRSEPIDISAFLTALPEEGEVPFMPGWKYFHTPGHAPGHISLFRDSDKVLIAGDAFVTTKPESLLSTITQKQKVYGPPMYFTCDWEAAATSVQTLVKLNPEIVATGHGKPFSGSEMKDQLKRLAENFKEEALPEQGRYLDEPAVADASGVLYVPPESTASLNKWIIAAGVVVAGLLVFGLVKYTNKKKNKQFL